MKERTDRWFVALAALQTRRAAWISVVGLLISLASLPFVQRLRLNSAWTALLPADKPSVRDLEQVKDKVGGLSTLTVALQSQNLPAMQRFARDLAPRLQAMPQHAVRAVDWNIGDYKTFVEKHRHLYADLGELQDIRDALQDRLDYEKRAANPFYVDLEGQPPSSVADTVGQMERRAAAARAKFARYPEGFYVHPRRDLLVLFVRADLTGGDSIGGRALIDGVRKLVAQQRPTQYAADMRVDYAGDIWLAQEEHDAIVEELTLATSLTVLLVLAVIYLFFRRWRALLMLSAALLPPVMLTFAATQLLIHYLNTSTAFLGSIVIGNGINPLIIWLARYFEERRRSTDLQAAVLRTHLDTRLAIWTASMAAAIAYGSLIVTDFRGFRDFGIIGGLGMVFCWLSTLFLLPSLCVLLERLPTLRRRSALRGDAVYGQWLWRIVQAAPRSITLLSALLGALSLVLIGIALAADPIEYDFRKLKSVRENSTQAMRIQARLGDIISSADQGNGIAMLLPSQPAAAQMRRQLEQRRDRHGAPYGAVRSIDSLLPADQAIKRPLLADIRRLLTTLRPYADAKQQRQIDEHLPPAVLNVVRDADLPEAVVRPFTEKDGTRGRILVIEKASNAESIWDGRFLVRWAKSLRKVHLPDGTTPPLAGRAPVFADMVEVVQTDGPKAVLISFGAILLLVLLAFRGRRERWVTMASLLLGIAWMGGMMVILRIKLNFLNFVAFPITFGIGVDYAVNVMRRYALDQRKGDLQAIQHAVQETGGAVILCSLTTIIGYASLHASSNLALNSFGAAMVISEVACLLAAVLSGPALLVWLHRRSEPRSLAEPRSLSELQSDKMPALVPDELPANSESSIS